MDPVIATQQLTKVYGSGEGAFVALDNINISIERSSAVGIRGKSGSGKSTLMHLLALLDQPTHGTLFIEGSDAHQLPPKKLDLLRNKTFGFVFQQFFLNGNDTALNNVVLPLKIAGVSRTERNERGLHALTQVDLLEKAASHAVNLSGGQKQRVCIARALINNPSIIFADEPTGNLDSSTGNSIMDLLFKLNTDHGITLIIVTHDIELSSRCQRQIHLVDGRIVNEVAS